MYEIPIERGKILEFARAISSTNPAFGGATPIVPPTFLTTAMLTWEPRQQSIFHELGFSMARLLHGEETYTFHGAPPRAGDALQATSHITDRYEKEGKRGGKMRFATVVTEFRDTSGTLVAEQHSTFVETAKAPTEAAS